MISPGSPHVRPTERTCGEPDEIELTAMGVELNGSQVRQESDDVCILLNETQRAGPRADKYTLLANTGHDVKNCDLNATISFYDTNHNGDVTLDEFEVAMSHLDKCCVPFLTASCSTLTAVEQTAGCTNRFYSRQVTIISTARLMQQMIDLGDTTYFPGCSRVHTPSAGAATGMAGPAVAASSLFGQVVVAHEGYTGQAEASNTAMHIVDDSAQLIKATARKNSRSIFQVGVFLDFVRLTTRAPHGARATSQTKSS